MKICLGRLRKYDPRALIRINPRELVIVVVLNKSVQVAQLEQGGQANKGDREAPETLASSLTRDKDWQAPYDSHSTLNQSKRAGKRQPSRFDRRQRLDPAPGIVQEVMADRRLIACQRVYLGDHSIGRQL